MKKELNKYILTVYSRDEKRVISSIGEYVNLLNKINGYNSNDKNPYIIGNITYNKNKYGKYDVIFQVYKKLTSKIPLCDIDNITMEYSDKNELCSKYNIKYTSDIKIAYFNNVSYKYKNGNDVDRRISFLDVIYKDDKEYLYTSKIIECIDLLIRNNDYGFFLQLANKYEYNRSLTDIIEKLRYYVNKAKDNRIRLEDTQVGYLCKDLYISLINEKDKKGNPLKDENGNKIVSHKRKRDFGLYIKSYMERNIEKQNNNFDIYMMNRIEREEDFIMEEEALDRWDGIKEPEEDDFSLKYKK